MLERLLTGTKIYVQDSFSAAELDKVITYGGGVNSRVCIIQDSNDFVFRDMMIDELKTMRDVLVRSDVYPNPKTDDIMKMTESLKEEGISVIVGIGGGSALDSAKAVAMLLSNGGDLDDYLGSDATRKIEKKEICLILIPTTSGTGSEVTRFGVYTSRSGRKYTLAHNLFQADLALLITQLTYTLPPKLTAVTGFDALSHALETVWNKNATPISDIVAIESAVYILQWIETAYKSSASGERVGRKEMLMGACKAGIAFNQTGTAAVHALSFILSEEWNIPHGLACAFTLEDVLKLNAENDVVRAKLCQIARRLFGDGSEEELITYLLDRIIALKKEMRLPCTFDELGVEVKESDIPILFEKSFGDPKMGNNDPLLSKETVYEMLRKKI